MCKEARGILGLLLFLDINTYTVNRNVCFSSYKYVFCSVDDLSFNKIGSLRVDLDHDVGSLHLELLNVNNILGRHLGALAEALIEALVKCSYLFL